MGIWVIGILACLGLGTAGPAEAAEAQPTEVAVPGDYAGSLDWGPEGALWFASDAGLGRVDRDGAVTEVPLSASVGLVKGLAGGASTGLWLTAEAGPGETEVAHVTAAGAVARFPVQGYTEVGQIALDVQGNAWFTLWAPEYEGDNTSGKAWVVRVSSSGVMTRFALPGDPTRRDEGPGAIVAGPGGDMWFTDPALNEIGRISPRGKITEYHDPIPAETLAPTGRDELWFSGFGGVGMIDVAGKVRMIRVGSFEGEEITSGEGGAAVDGEGDLWFIDQSGVIMRATPSGSLTSVFPPVFRKANDVAAGPQGAIWISASGKTRTGANSVQPLMRYEPGIPAVEVRPRTTAIVRDGRFSVPLGCSGSTHGCAGMLDATSEGKQVAKARYRVGAESNGEGTLVLPVSARARLARAGYLRLGVSASTRGGFNGRGEITIRTARPSRPRPGRPVVIPLPEGAGTYGISPGPGGDLWLGSGVGQFSRVTPDGLITGTKVPGLAATPIATTSDSRGDLWFLESAGRGFFSGDELQPVVGRLDAAGRLSQFHLPPGPEMREGIAITRDGAAWVSRFDYGEGRGEIDRVGPDGKVKRFPIRAKELWAGVAAAQDGGVWFSESGARIVHLASDGRMHSFLAPHGGDVWNLVAAPEGDVWFTHRRPGLPSAIGRLSPTGRFTEYDVRGRGLFESLVLAPDGNLWFSIGPPDRIGRMTPNGKLTTWRRGGAATGYSAVGREGSIWFASVEQNTLAIFRP